MDLGLVGGFSYLTKYYDKLPFQTIYAADNDPYCAAIFDSNSDIKCDVIDVKDIVPSLIPDHDILIGGFPCQSFSIVAQNPPRLGYDDEKGKLFFEMVEILNEKKPRFFIAENVKGLLSANKRQAFPLILNEFRKAGYDIKFRLLNASNFGIPQKRERVFIIGFRDYDDYVSFDFPTPTTLNKNQKLTLRSVV